jgi:hypothetical protein
MRKFKLIKEYPGSGDLGVMHLGCNSYEEYPEFYEEVIENIYYMVSLIDMGFHNAWEPMRVETIRYDTDTKKYFSTKEGARDFIIQHKPCLSFNEVRGLVGHSFFSSTSHQRLFELVKSRICQ